MTIYADACLPLDPPPDEITWTLTEGVGYFPPAYGAAVSQRVRYGNARWQAKVKYTNLSLEQRAAVLAFIAKVGRFRTFWLNDFSNAARGSFPSQELIASPNAAATWSASGGNRAFSADLEGVRVAASVDATKNIATAAAITVTASDVYALQAVFESISGAASVGLRAGNTQYATDAGSSVASTTMRRHWASATPSGVALYPGWSDSITADTNWTAGVDYVVRQASLRRALLVDGGTAPTAQNGNAVYVKNAPTSTVMCLSANDMVEIMSSATAANRESQIVRLTEHFNTDSSGKGRLVFEPTLRFNVNNNALIVPGNPRARVIIVEDVGAMTRPPRFISDLEFTCEECYL